jgi:protein-disulfide isomerase
VNDTKREGTRAARERLAAERERHRTREKRRRTLIVAAAATGVLGLAAVAGVLAVGADGSPGSDAAEGPPVAPSGATGKGGLAIPVGRAQAKSTLTVWEDFRCPACRQFESTYRPTIHELTRAGKLKVEYHLVRLIDHNLKGTGSLHAANAAACAQQAGKFSPYHDVLYENQPEETDDSYADDATLIRLAGKVPGLDTPAFRRCVHKGTHSSWVVHSDQAFRDHKFGGTPTVLLNGRNVYDDPSHPLTPQKLKAAVDAAEQADRS